MRHAARQLPAWLIFDVGRNDTSPGRCGDSAEDARHKLFMPLGNTPVDVCSGQEAIYVGCAASISRGLRVESSHHVQPVANVRGRRTLEPQRFRWSVE